MKVLVTGGTGFVGTALCTALDERGHDVTALARTPDDSTLPESIATVAGDVTDYDSVEPAFEGVDAVVNLVALSPLFKPSGGEQMHDVIHRGGTETVVRAAKAHDIERFVQMSALGADPDGSTAYIRSKGKAERIVRESGLDWVIVRPSVVFGDGGEFVRFTKLLTTPYLTGLPGGGKTRFQPIWLDDLAPMLADAVDDDRHLGNIYELGGQEVLTLAAVAHAAYEAEGSSLRVLPVPMALAGLGLSIADPIPGIPMGRDQYRALQFDNTCEDNDVTAFGVDPSDLTTLQEYLASDDGTEPPNADNGSRNRRLATANSTLLVFLALIASWSLPYFVDIYTSPLTVAAAVPSYLVTMLFYDSPIGLENVVYALEGLLPGGRLLWEAGNLVTYYLVALATAWIGRRGRSTFRETRR